MSLLLLIIVINTLPLQTEEQLIALPESASLFTSCISRLLLNDTKISKGNIMAMNIYGNFQFPFIIYDYRRPITWFIHEVKASAFVMDFINIELLTEMLQKFRFIREFNPRAKFIVRVPNLLKEIWKTFNKYYIYDVLIILENISGDIEYFVQDRLNFLKIGYCNENVEEVKDLAPNPEPINLNKQIEARFYRRKPYAEVKECELENGIEIFLYCIIQDKMKLDFDLTGQTNEFLKESSGNKYTKVYINIQKLKILSIFGRIILSDQKEHLDFDISAAYMSDSFRFLFPEPVQVPSWKGILMIFDTDVWINYLVIYFLIVLLLFVINKFSVNSFNGLLSGSKVFVLTYQFLFENFSRIPASNLSWRIFLSVWLFYIFIFNTAFRSKFLFFLIADTYENQIKTWHDLMQTSHKFIIPTYVWHQIQYEYNSSAIYRFLIDNVQKVCTSTYDCIGGAKTYEAIPLVAELEAKHEAYEYFKTNGEMFQVSEFAVSPIHIHSIFAKGHPLFEPINRYLTTLQEVGLIQYVQKHFERMYDQTEKLFKANRAAKKFQPLMMKNFVLLFCIYGVGIFVSCLVFLYEIKNCGPEFVVYG